jgi:ATP-binding cassette subfamily B (MDR/TAP) protein 1
VASLIINRYGGQLLASHEYTPFNYRKDHPFSKEPSNQSLVVVYLAVVQGSISAGQSMSFGPSISATRTANEFCSLHTDVTQAFAAANRIRGMRPRSEGESIDPLDLGLEGNEKEPSGVKIELRNVSFRYSTRDVPVLNDLSMTVS